ncbi:hypothetical protein D3C79_647460 [compost metagenome]
MALFIDLTDFESRIDPWNAWEREPNGSMLIILGDQSNHYIGYENWAGTLKGRILSKMLVGLTPGTHYRVSLRVKRKTITSLNPLLWFLVDHETELQKFVVRGAEWQTLNWTFQADQASHHLTLVGDDDTLDPIAEGSELSYDDIRIYPVTITENLDGQPAQTISQGEEVQLLSKTMTIKLLEDPLGIKAFIEPTAAEPGMREGPAITLQRQQHHQPNNPQKLQITPVLPCSELKFFWTWRQFPGEVEFYGLHGNLLTTLSYTGEPRHHEVKYNAPDGEQIAWIVVICRDYAYLDNFTLTTA